MQSKKITTRVPIFYKCAIDYKFYFRGKEKMKGAN